MWLIQFHFAFSLLSLLCHAGIKVVFAEKLKRYKTNGKKKRPMNYLLYFCPVINILFLFTLLYMAICDDDTADNINSRAQEDEK